MDKHHQGAVCLICAYATGCLNLDGCAILFNGTLGLESCVSVLLGACVVCIFTVWGLSVTVYLFGGALSWLWDCLAHSV